MAKVLVTGGSGFIGSHLVQALRAAGAEVVSYDIRDGKDILNRELLRASLIGVDTVFHLAALVSVPQSMDDPVGAHVVNVSGTVVVLEESRKAGVRRVVYSSSAAVYGDEPSMPKTENSPIAPKSPYALSKYLGEVWCKHYTQVYGLETVIVRYMNVFGPNQATSGGYGAIVPIAIQVHQKGGVLTVHGDGTQTRDFIYVDDVVSANLLAAERGVPGEVYVIASGVEVSVNDVVASIGRASGQPVSVVYGAPRIGDIYRSVGSGNKALRELGWWPRTSLDEGIKRILGA